MSAGAGAAALLVITLPWTIAGGMDWVQRGYVDNFKTPVYEETTLKAFNIWYLEALHLEAIPSQNPLDTSATIAGVAKGTWGNLLVLAALAVLARLSWRRLRARGELALLWFSALWLWSTFMWPTKVHERYIMYAIPLVAMCSFGLKRLWPAAIALALVGSAELCHNVWLKAPPGVHAKTAAAFDNIRSRVPPDQVAEWHRQRQERLREIEADRDAQRPLEYSVLAASLLAYAWAFVSPFLRLGEAPSGKPPSPGKTVPGGKRR
jgi:hypothetical protein